MKYLIKFLCIIFLLSGCTDIGILSTAKNNREKNEIAGNRIYVTQIYSDQSVPSNYRLNFRTEEIYGCVNYLLLFDQNIENNVITIDFNGIFVPEICFTALGPATGAAEFGDIASGVYRLVFDNEKTVSGILYVSDNGFLISLEDTTQVVIENNYLPR